MMYARSPLSGLRTAFSSTSPAVIAFCERTASRPASRAVRVATMRTTKAAASSTAAAALNNSIRAERDLAMPTGPAKIDGGPTDSNGRRGRRSWFGPRRARSRVCRLEQLGDRAADLHRPAHDAHPLDLELGELLGDPLRGQLVGGLGLLARA